MKKIINFILECVAELKKVAWPTRDDVVSQTTVVVVSVVIIACALAFIDYISYLLIEKIILLGK